MIVVHCMYIYIYIDDCTLHENKQDPCVQVKNNPCVECIITMRLISWNHSRGSETCIVRNVASRAARNVATGQSGV